MNKMLVAVFDNAKAADAGLHALRALHTEGDITLYATGILSKDAKGVVSVQSTADGGPTGTVTGLAVGSLIGLLGGPVGLAIGAVTGSVIGALRDYWVVGVGLDFVEEARERLLPGTVAVVAEIEEEWVIPVDLALEALGGHVFRRTRGAAAEAQFDHDFTAIRAEIKELETETAQASGAAKIALQAKLASAKKSLDGAVIRAKEQATTLTHEAQAKAESLSRQLGETTGAVKARIEHRIQQVKSTYHARGAKLSHAWSLTREALVG